MVVTVAGLVGANSCGGGSSPTPVSHYCSGGDPSEEVRIWSAAALGHIGPPARAAIATLAAASLELAKHPRLAAAAEEALQQVRDNSR
jgi:anthranilate phosphoribosyltransferase